VLGEQEQGDIQSVMICKLCYYVGGFAVADIIVNEQIILILIIENKGERLVQGNKNYQWYAVSFFCHNIHVGHFKISSPLPCA
jgi:hypothetical protein